MDYALKKLALLEIFKPFHVPNDIIQFILRKLNFLIRLDRYKHTCLTMPHLDKMSFIKRDNCDFLINDFLFGSKKFSDYWIIFEMCPWGHLKENCTLHKCTKFDVNVINNFCLKIGYETFKELELDISTFNNTNLCEALDIMKILKGVQTHHKALCGLYIMTGITTKFWKPVDDQKIFTIPGHF